MRILITAGPTREAIDPVRFLSNRSSGRMGFALASAAARARHDVVLVAGPASATLDPAAPAERIDVIDVVSAEEMYEAVAREIQNVEVAVMAAAVADYRPANVPDQKIKKQDAALLLELEPTRDILGSARGVMGFEGTLVGFAAETENLEENARAKLEKKGCDLVVANDVGRADIGFDVEENEIVLLYPGGESEMLPKSSKGELAVALMERIERIVEEKAPKV